MNDKQENHEFNEADSRADAFAALSLIVIAACAMIYYAYFQ